MPNKSLKSFRFTMKINHLNDANFGEFINFLRSYDYDWALNGDILHFEDLELSDLIPDKFKQ